MKNLDNLGFDDDYLDITTKGMIHERKNWMARTS